MIKAGHSKITAGTRMFPVSKTWLNTSSILKPFELARMPSWASTPCFKNCRVLNHHIPMRAWQTHQSLVKPWAVPRSCSECENRQRDFRRAPWSTRDLTRVFGSFGSRVFNMLPEVCAFPCVQTKVESIFEGPCLNGIKSSKQRLHFRTSLLLARGSMKMSADKWFPSYPCPKNIMQWQSLVIS